MGTYQLEKWKRLTLAALIVVNLLTIAFRETRVNKMVNAEENRGNPPGVIRVDDQTCFVRDFYMHRAFIERIWHKVTPRPYTLAGQEAIFRNWAPRCSAGMPHAYSPTTAILGAPFLLVSPEAGSWIFMAINLTIIFLLYRFYLFPRIDHFYGLIAVAIFGVSVCLMSTIAVGQTAVATAGAVALTWHFLYDPKEKRLRILSTRDELLLGLLFYCTTAKPPFAILLGAILIGARAWRPFLIGAGAFLITCFFMANYYGGWPIWLEDYIYFLRHYYRAGMSPFFQSCFCYEVASDPVDFLALIAHISDQTSAAIFQPLWLGGAGLIAFLGLRSLIKPSTAFQLQLANILLLAPYLRIPEDILITLIIGEGVIFGMSSRVLKIVKLGLLFVIFDMKNGPFDDVLHCTPPYPGKLILFAIVLIELLMSRRKNFNTV